jgi:hypothetical protein
MRSSRPVIIRQEILPKPFPGIARILDPTIAISISLTIAFPIPFPVVPIVHELPLVIRASPIILPAAVVIAKVRAAIELSPMEAVAVAVIESRPVGGLLAPFLVISIIGYGCRGNQK